MLGKTNVKVKPNKKVDYVEYIESTGTQYIDTGVVPTSKTKWVYDYQFLSSTSITNNASQNGCGIPNDSKRFVITYYDGKFLASIGVNGSNVTGDANRHTFMLDVPNKQAKIDNSTISCPYTSFSATEEICFFTRKNDGDVATYMHRGKLYSSKIYDGDRLIRDFKPCKDGAGVYCLYDEVEKRYYYNQGLGNFKGEGWEPTQLEYIKATGTQYINTGVKPTTKTTYEISVEIDTPTVKTDTCLFGARGSGGGDNTKQYVLWDGHNTDDVSRRTIPVFGSLSSAYYYTPPTTKTVFKYDGSKFYCNDEVIFSMTNSTGYNSYPIYLFALNNGGTADSRMYKGKLYYFKIYADGVLIRDYIPVIDLNNVVCLYDRVNQEFVYNAGTGDFLGGVAA